jgi:DNA polymerase I-like protein with 3'-5' exonuclease and polymerase domains/intein/homing endonuclease
MGKPKTKYHILENEQQLDMLIDACKKTGYASVDFETTGNRIYNNDFYPTILGVCFEPGRAGVIPLGHFDSKFKKSWKTKLQKFGEEVIANENIVKVAWNAKFDMQVFHKYGIFHKGRLFDGMLAKYVLDEAKPNDLKSMVRRFLPKFGDYEEDYEGCNLPWDQKPLLGLSQYCAIDTDMCLRLFLFFEKKMMDKKFYHLFRNLIMPASNLLTKVETRGQRLDKEWHGKLMEEYPRRILEAETKVRALKKVKRFEKSLIQQRLDKAISKIEEEIRESKKVIKTSDDSRKIASAERSIKNREEKIARLMAGEFNTKSEKAIIEPINFGSASQMTQLLFTDPKGFKFPVVKYTQKDKRDTDNPSSSEAVLLELQKTDKTGFIDTLLELRGLKQINNMFVKGFANLVQDDGRLHPKFNIHGTRTGRLSSTDPNSQQLPRVATDPTIRRCLVASPGRLYLMMDYSQCIDGDSYIFCNTGIKKLKEIIPGKDKICMIDPQHKNKHRVLNIKVLANKGKAECLRITTNTGRQLILTEEHPVKTKQGFTLAKDLKLNDTLYIENLFGTKSVGRLLINSDEAYIAGLFYGDGHYPKEKSGKRKPTDMSIFFSTGSDREELQPLLDNYFGCEFYGPKNTSRGIRGHSDKVLSFYKKYPKKDSHEMEIPKRILKSDLESKMNFIGGQIDSDGSIGNGRFRYTSACESYIRQLQLLFQSVGFHGIIRSTTTILNENEYTEYHLIVNYGLSRLKPYLRLKRKKQEIIDWELSKQYAVPANKTSHCSTQRIPLEIYQDLPRTSEFHKTYRNSLRKGRLIHSTLETYIDELSELDSRWLDVHHFMYEQITNIEKVGKREVYDMEVENLHEFNPNGIRVHNCELRLMAHLSKCKGLLEAFAKGWDPHLSVACKKYGVNYDDIYPIYKDEQHPDYTTWKIRRKQAKHIVFGCIYHIGAAKLAEELSDPKTGLVVTPKESQGFLDDFFKDFPEVKKFMDNQMKFIHKHGYIKTLFGRKRRCPEIFGDNQMQIVAAENAAINTPSQSAASDMALFTSILIDELIQKGEFPDLQEVGTVHDSIYFDTLPQDINPKTIYQLWDMARNPSTKEWFGFQIDDIDMSMDFEVGRSQGEELPFAVGYDYNRLLNFKGEWKGSKEEEYYFSLVNKCKSVDIKDYPKVYSEYFK